MNSLRRIPQSNSEIFMTGSAEFASRMTQEKGSDILIVLGSISGLIPSADQQLTTATPGTGLILGLEKKLGVLLDERDYTKMCYSPDYYGVWKPWLDSASVKGLKKAVASSRPLQTESQSLEVPANYFTCTVSLELGHPVFKTPIQTLKRVVKLQHLSKGADRPLEEQSQPSPLREFGSICVDLADWATCIRAGCAYWVSISLRGVSFPLDWRQEAIIYSPPSCQKGDTFQAALESVNAPKVEISIQFTTVKGSAPRNNNPGSSHHFDTNTQGELRLSQLDISFSPVASQTFVSSGSFTHSDKIASFTHSTTPVVVRGPSVPNYRYNINLPKSRSPKVVMLSAACSQVRNNVEGIFPKGLIGALEIQNLQNTASGDSQCPIGKFSRPLENPNLTLELLVGNRRKLLSQATQRESCFILQKLAENLDSTKDGVLISNLIQTLLPIFSAIACDGYGNFFLQQLLDKANGYSISSILEAVPDMVLVLSTNKVGIFTIQKLISVLKTTAHRQQFMEKIRQSRIEQLATHPLSAFMFKKMLASFPEESAFSLLELLEPHFLSVASDKHGICVVKLVLSALESTPRGYNIVLGEFLQHIEKGKSNSHFNFGIHHLLESAYNSGYTSPALELLVLGYLRHGEGKLRLRSRAVLQTVLLLLQYPDQSFRLTQIIPALRKALCRPAGQQELYLLGELVRTQPDTKVNVNLIRSCFLTAQMY